MKRLLLIICSISLASRYLGASEGGQKALEAISSVKTMNMQELVASAVTDRLALVPQVQTLHLSEDLRIDDIVSTMQCSTEFGATVLKTMLEHPVQAGESERIIAHRQYNIRLLHDNKELFDEVTALLAQAADLSQDIQHLFSAQVQNFLCPELVKTRALAGQKTKEAWMHKKVLTRPIGYACNDITAVAGLALTLWFIKKQLGSTAVKSYFSFPSSEEMREALEIVRQKYIQQGLLFDVHNLSRQQRLEVEIESLKLHVSTTEFITGASLLGTSVVDVFKKATSFYDMYQRYQQAKLKRSLMHALHKLVTIAQRCEALLGAYDAPAAHPGQLRARLFHKVGNITHKKTKEVLAELATDRYAQKDLIFFNSYAVHAFLHKLYTCQLHFKELFACIGEMDAYHACAKKMREGISSNPLCFTSFLPGQEMKINAQRFYNPLVQSPVANDFTDTNSAVITGSNAGGKSTAIRALFSSVLGAHTFGIGFAKEFSCTPVDIMHTFLHITDDPMLGNSRFFAETEGAATVVQTLAGKRPEQSYLFAFDELFTGTSNKEGEECAQGFIENVMTFANKQFFYGTHFDVLKKMGKTIPGLANYCVGAPVLLEGGKLKYPFTFGPGIGTSQGATHIARHKGIFLRSKL